MSFSTRTLLVLAVVLAVTARDGAAELAPEAGLSAGAARIEITPDVNMINWVSRKPYGSVLDPIFVRAVVIGCASERVAILTWDLVATRESAVADARGAI